MTMFEYFIKSNYFSTRKTVKPISPRLAVDRNLSWAKTARAQRRVGSSEMKCGLYCSWAPDASPRRRGTLRYRPALY